VAVVGSVLVVRPLWLIVSERLPSRLHTRLGQQAEDDDAPRNPDPHRHLGGAEILALTWSGTRGVITLAAAFSLPLTVHGGAAFPARDLLLFAAYLVVLVTLVGQGLTFGVLLKRLRLGNPYAGQALLRNQARTAAVKAALERLEQLVGEERLPSDIVENLRRAAQRRLDRYVGRVDRLSGTEDGVVPADDPYYVAARARRAMIDAERDELLQWRDSGRLPDASLRILLRELDHEEGLLPRV